jgi:OHCU decarboxylase
MPLTIAEVNALSPDDFVDRFGDVAEHSPWVAESAAIGRPYRDREMMIAAFALAVDKASNAERLALIRAHPDLAGRAARAGTMAADSKKEQAGAGLSSLSDDEWTRFHDLNDRYRTRFGFPFVLAVKGATRADILAAFEARLANDPLTERAEAITQICRIFRFRIEDRVTP